MSTLYLKPLGGIAGDMLLAAVLDGADMKEILQSYLKRLPLKDWKLLLEDGEDRKEKGKRLSFMTEKEQPQRNLADIVNIVKEAAYPPEIENNILKTFDILGEAEAKAHNTTRDQIHFHEVGAADTILDISGACILKYLFHIDEVICEPLPMGHGTVKCCHGELELPAPAVKLMLKDVPVRDGEEQGETVTPTGIALLKAWDCRFIEEAYSENNSEQRLTLKGTGLGSRKGCSIPNALKIFITEPLVKKVKNQNKDVVYKIECTVDDMTGEELGFLRERLEESSVRDCYYTPVMMKKNRPGTKITVICDEKDFEVIKETLFKHSSTLGFIYTETERCIMERKIIPHNPIPLKEAKYKDISKIKGEYEKAAETALESNCSLREILREAEQKQ